MVDENVVHFVTKRIKVRNAEHFPIYFQRIKILFFITNVAITVPTTTETQGKFIG